MQQLFDSLKAVLKGKIDSMYLTETEDKNKKNILICMKNDSVITVKTYCQVFAISIYIGDLEAEMYCRSQEEVISMLK